MLIFSDEIKKDFIKIGFSTYVHKDNLEKIWVLENINGVDYLVPSDSAFLLKRNYTLSKNGNIINIYKNNNYVDSIQIDPLYDVDKLFEVLQKNVVQKFSMLPEKLFVEALKKEADFLSKKFIRAAMLLKKDANTVTNKQVLIKIEDNVLKTIQDIQKTLNYYINFISELFKLNIIPKEDTEKYTTLQEKLIKNNEELENFRKKFSNTFNMTIENIEEKTINNKQDLNEFVNYINTILKNMDLQITPIVENIEIDQTYEHIEITKEQISEKIKTSISEILIREFSNILKENKIEKKEDETKKIQEKEKEESKVVLTSSILKYLQPPKFSILALITKYKNDCKKIIIQNLVQILQNFSEYLKDVKLDVNKIVEDFLNNPEEFKIVLPEINNKNNIKIDKLIELALASSISKFSIYFQNLNIDVLSDNPLLIYYQKLGDKFLEDFKAFESSSGIVEKIKELCLTNKDLFNVQKIDLFIAKLIFYGDNLASTLDKFVKEVIPAIDTFFIEIQSVYNPVLYQKAFKTEYGESMKKAQEELESFFKIENLDPQQQTYVKSIINKIVGKNINLQNVIKTLEDYHNSLYDKYSIYLKKQSELDKRNITDKDKEELNKLKIDYLTHGILFGFWITKTIYSPGADIIEDLLNTQQGAARIVDDMIRLINYSKSLNNVASSISSHEESHELKEKIEKFLPRPIAADREAYLWLLLASIIQDIQQKNKGVMPGESVNYILSKLEELSKKYKTKDFSTVFSKAIKDITEFHLKDIVKLFNDLNDVSKNLNETTKEIYEKLNLNVIVNNKSTLGKIFNESAHNELLSVLNEIQSSIKFDSAINKIFVDIDGKLIPIDEFENNYKAYLKNYPEKLKKIDKLLNSLKAKYSHIKNPLSSLAQSVFYFTLNKTTDVSTPKFLENAIKNLLNNFPQLKKEFQKSDLFGSLIETLYMTIQTQNRAKKSIIPEIDIGSMFVDENVSIPINRFVGRYEPYGDPSMNLALKILNQKLINNLELYILALHKLDKDPDFQRIYSNLQNLLSDLTKDAKAEWLNYISQWLPKISSAFDRVLNESFFVDFIDKKIKFLSENLNKILKGEEFSEEHLQQKKIDLESVKLSMESLKDELLNSEHRKDLLKELQFKMANYVIFSLFSSLDLYKIYTAYKQINKPDDFLRRYIEGTNIAISSLENLLKKYSSSVSTPISFIDIYKNFLTSNKFILNYLNEILNMLTSSFKLTKTFDLKFGAEKTFPEPLKEFDKKIKETTVSLENLLNKAALSIFVKTTSLQSALFNILNRIIKDFPVSSIKDFKSFPTIIHMRIQQIFSKAGQVDLFRLKSVSEDIYEKLQILKQNLEDVKVNLENIVNKKGGIEQYKIIVEILDKHFTSLEQEKKLLEKEKNALEYEKQKLLSSPDVNQDRLNILNEKINQLNQRLIQTVKRLKLLQGVFPKAKEIVQKKNITEEDINQLFEILPKELSLLPPQQLKILNIPSTKISHLTSSFVFTIDKLDKILKTELYEDADRFFKFMYFINKVTKINLMLFNEISTRRLLRDPNLVSIPKPAELFLNKKIASTGSELFYSSLLHDVPEPISSSLIRNIKEKSIELYRYNNKVLPNIFESGYSDLSEKQIIDLLANLIYLLYTNYMQINVLTYDKFNIFKINTLIKTRSIEELNDLLRDLGYSIILTEENFDKQIDAVENILIKDLKKQNNVQQSLKVVSKLDISSIFSEIIKKSSVFKDVALEEIESKIDEYINQAVELVKDALKTANFPIEEAHMNYVLSFINTSRKLPSIRQFIQETIAAKISEEKGENPIAMQQEKNVKLEQINKLFDTHLHNILKDPGLAEAYHYKAPYFVNVSSYAGGNIQLLLNSSEYKKLKLFKQKITKNDLDKLVKILSALFNETSSLLEDLKYSPAIFSYKSLLNGTYNLLTGFVVNKIENALLPYLMDITDFDPNDITLDFLEEMDNRVAQFTSVIINMFLMLSIIKIGLRQNTKIEDIKTKLDTLIDNIIAKFNFNDKKKLIIKKILNSLITIIIEIVIPSLDRSSIYNDLQNEIFISYKEYMRQIKMFLHIFTKFIKLAVDENLEKEIKEEVSKLDLKETPLQNIKMIYENISQKMSTEWNKQFEEFFDARLKNLERFKKEIELVSDEIQKIKEELENL